MAYNHIQIKDLPYCKPIGKWLKDRYGEVQAEEIWQKTVSQYNAYLPELPDYGGKKNGHAMAIYGGLAIFSLYPNLPDEPPMCNNGIVITGLKEFDHDISGGFSSIDHRGYPLSMILQGNKQ